MWPPCLITFAEQGVNINPLLIQISPRIFQIDAIGVQVQPELLTIDPTLINIGPNGVLLPLCSSDSVLCASPPCIDCMYCLPKVVRPRCLACSILC